jgi:hypothetical protein
VSIVGCVFEPHDAVKMPYWHDGGVTSQWNDVTVTWHHDDITVAWHHNDITVAWHHITVAWHHDDITVAWWHHYSMARSSDDLGLAFILASCRRWADLSHHGEPLRDLWPAVGAPWPQASPSHMWQQGTPNKHSCRHFREHQIRPTSSKPKYPDV